MQLSWLRPVYEHPGPYATVALDTTRSTETATQEVELRWRALREQLTEQKAPDDLLDALEASALAPTGVSGPHGLVLVGAGNSVVLARTVPEPPATEIASWSPVPHLFPLVRGYADAVSHILIVADRQGADVSVHGPRGEQLGEHTVKGDTHHIRKVHAGGWSELRYQHTVENVWAENADKVAREVERLYAEHKPQLVLAAGDVRALQILEGQLGKAVAERFVPLQSGGRAAGTDDDALDEEIERIVAQTSLERASEVAGTFAQELGRSGAAVEGLAEVVDALRRAQVETLLVHDDPSSTAELWTAPDQPAVLAVTAEEVSSLGVEEPIRDRADAVLLRALVGTDAGIVLLADPTVEVRDGVGAVLRYADASTPS